MTYEDLDKTLEKHNLWLNGDPAGERANLTNADLNKKTLRAVKLRGASLINANLFLTYFRDADLRNTDLSWANLRSADLTHADLSNADLTGADLTGADLTGARLVGANLDNACLRDTYLIGADLRNAYLGLATFKRANLKDANFTGASLKGIDFKDANLSGAIGLMSTIDFIKSHFEQTEDGIIAYKTFNCLYKANPEWKIEPGSIIEENVNFNKTQDCGCGINVAPLAWVKRYYKDETIWKVLIRWEWLCGVCVPYMSDGKIRCERVEILEKVE